MGLLQVGRDEIVDEALGLLLLVLLKPLVYIIAEVFFMLKLLINLLGGLPNIRLFFKHLPLLHPRPMHQLEPPNFLLIAPLLQFLDLPIRLLLRDILIVVNW